MSLTLWLRTFYFTLFTRVFFYIFNGWGRYRIDRPMESLWPLQLFSYIPHGIFVDLFFIGSFLFSLLCVINPWSRVFRFLSFFFLFFSVAVHSSYGKVVHGYHGWIFVLLVLVFLPKKSIFQLDVKSKHSFSMLVIACAQVVGVLPYFLAGVWKVREGVICLQSMGFACIENSFINAMGWEFVLHGHQMNQWTSFLLQHPLWTGIPFLILVYFQTLSPFFAMRPNTHFIFGSFAVIFHILSDLLLKIPFYHQMVLMMILFLLSPRAKGSRLTYQSFQALPGLGLCASFLNKMKRNLKLLLSDSKALKS